MRNAGHHPDPVWYDKTDKADDSGKRYKDAGHERRDNDQDSFRRFNRNAQALGGFFANEHGIHGS